ncbi:MAG: hypothetical protein ACLUI7_01525 [Coprococcus sp.]
MINMLFNGVPANIMALAGLVFAFIMTCLLLVKCNDRLPKDQGREFAVNGALSAGKPRGAGFIFILVFIAQLFFASEYRDYYLPCIGSADYRFSMIIQVLGELKKGFLDFAIAVMVAITFLNLTARCRVCNLRRQYHDPSGDLRYSDRCSCMGIHQCDKLQ